MKTRLPWRFPDGGQCLAMLLVWLGLYAVRSARAQTCTFTGFPMNGPACARPELTGRQCPAVPLDTKITWSPGQPLVSLQCYRGGSSPFNEILNPQSGAVTVSQCVKDQEGDAEIKGWPGGPTPCSVTVNAVRSTPSVNCSSAKLTVQAPVKFNTPVTWTPSECTMIAQGYEQGVLAGQTRAVGSGVATIEQLTTGSADEVLVKIWSVGASQSSDERALAIRDCGRSRFTVSTVPAFETKVTWIPASCVAARIEAFQGGKSIGRVDRARSGERSFGEIVGAASGLTELRLYGDSLSAVADSRWAEVNKGSPAFLGSFSDDFAVNKGWLEGITEEIPNSACYNTGVGQVEFTSDVTRGGKRSLRLIANQKGWKASNHVIVGNRLTDAGQTGPWNYVVWFYLPSDTALSGESGPEISLQNTTQEGSGTKTYIAGLQHQTNPQADPAKRNSLAIWIPGATGGPWVQVATQPVPRDRWLRIELEANFERNEYVRFSVTGDGVSLSVPLAGRRIVGEDRKFAPAFVATLEGENQNTCSNPASTKNIVYYSDIQLSRPPAAVVSSASLLPVVSPDSFITTYGYGLAPQTEAPPALPWPFVLGNTQVRLKDSAGTEQNCPLLFVSAGQINCLAPAALTLGLATATVITYDRVAGAGSVQVNAIAPGLFTVNAADRGPVAGSALCCDSDGHCQRAPLYSCVSACVTAPIALCESTFLEVYGTGIKGRRSLSGVSATIDGVDVPVQYAGPQAGPGLDQVNIGPLQRILGGRGEVDLVLTVDGKEANKVRVNIK